MDTQAERTVKLAPTQSRSLGEVSMYWDDSSPAMATTRPCFWSSFSGSCTASQPMTCSNRLQCCNRRCNPRETIDSFKLRDSSAEPVCFLVSSTDPVRIPSPFDVSARLYDRDPSKELCTPTMTLPTAGVRASRSQLPLATRALGTTTHAISS